MPVPIPLWLFLIILAGFTPTDYALSLADEMRFAPPPGITPGRPE